MKISILILSFLFMLPTTPAFAELIKDSQGGSYVPFQDFKLSWSDSLFEVFAGKYQDIKDSYCISNAKQACRKKSLTMVCKASINKSGGLGDCPEACKAWAKDCEDTSGSDIRKKFGDDIEEGE